MLWSIILLKIYIFSGLSPETMIKLLETIHLPDVLVTPLKNPNLGSFAFALIIYKLIAPLRYASTLYITVPIIKHLVKQGKIKPVPSRKRIKEMIKDKTEMIRDKMPGKKND